MATARLPGVWKVRIWGWVGVSFLVACLAGAARSHEAANIWSRRFDGWLVARPIDMEVDLSGPGSFEGPFEQTCSIAHGEVLELHAETSGRPVEDARMLEGLQAVVHVMDENGDEVFTDRFPPAFEEPSPDGRTPVLSGLWPFREGRYRLRLDVASGAPALRGLEQRLLARYELCGLEKAPGAVARGLSVVCLVLALCVCVPTLFCFLPVRPPPAGR